MSLENEVRITELRATAHPLRLQMLSLLTGAELSAAEVARELDVSQANASYHLRVLLDAGLLVIAGEEVVRGGRAKKYRHPWDAERPDHAPTSAEEGDDYVRVLADMVPRRFRQRRAHRKALLTDAELWVTPEVWSEVFDLLTRASRMVHAEARPPRTPGTVRTTVSVAAFEMETGADGKDTDGGEVAGR